MPKINQGPAKALAATLRAARKLFDAQTLEDVELEARKLGADPKKDFEAGLLRYKAGELRHKKEMKAASGQPKFVPPRPMPQESRSNGPVHAGSSGRGAEEPALSTERAVLVLESISAPLAAKFVKDYSEWRDQLPAYGKTVVEALGPKRAQEYEEKYQKCMDLAREKSQFPSAPPSAQPSASPPFKNPSPSAPPLPEHLSHLRDEEPKSTLVANPRQGWNVKGPPKRDPNEHLTATKASGHMADAAQWGFRPERERRAQLKSEGGPANAGAAAGTVWTTGGKTVELRSSNPAPANVKAPPNPAPTNVKPQPEPRPTGTKPQPKPTPAGAKPQPRPAPAGAKPQPKPTPAGAKPQPRHTPTAAKPQPKPTPGNAKRPSTLPPANAKGPTQPSLPVEPHHIDEAMQMLKSRGEYDRAWFVEDYALHLANRQRQSQLPIERVVEESRKEFPEHARYYEECLGMARGIADAERRASSSRPPEAPPPNDQFPLGYETAAWFFNPEPDFPAGAHEPERHTPAPERHTPAPERHAPAPEQQARVPEQKAPFWKEAWFAREYPKFLEAHHQTPGSRPPPWQSQSINVKEPAKSVSSESSSADFVTADNSSADGRGEVQAKQPRHSTSAKQQPANAAANAAALKRHMFNANTNVVDRAKNSAAKAEFADRWLNDQVNDTIEAGALPPPEANPAVPPPDGYPVPGKEPHWLFKKQGEPHEFRALSSSSSSTATPPAASVAPSASTVRTVSRNGYDYELDGQDRVSRASGQLSITPSSQRTRSAYNQRRAGGSDRLPDDDGGHYIGTQFGGSTESINHFAQNRNFNRGSYLRLENSWRDSIKSGSTVSVDIKPAYTGNSERPDSLSVNYDVTSPGGTNTSHQVNFMNRYGGV